MVSRVYALSTAALSRRLRLVTVCSKPLIVSATWVTCSVLVVAVWLLPLLDAGVPGVSFEKTFLCSHPSLFLSTWGVVCLALMYVVQCYMVRKLGPWLPTPFTDCVVTIVLWSAGFVGSSRRMTLQWTIVRLQNLPWSKTGLVSRQVLHPLSKLQNWIWSKTGRYKTGLVSNTKIEASLRATKPKPWQSNLTSDTVEIFIQNEKAGLVPMQSRFRSRHKAGLGAAGLGTAQSWFWSRHKASFGAVSRPV